jgi:hypothetical protein
VKDAKTSRKGDILGPDRGERVQELKREKFRKEIEEIDETMD